MRNKNILIFGSTGFIGRSLSKRLLANGNKLICPVRDPNRVKRNILSGDIGQIDVAEFDIHNLDNIEKRSKLRGLTRKNILLLFQFSLLNVLKG